MGDTILKAGQTLFICQTTRARTARNWIDEEAVARAIADLALEHPVRIRKVSNGARWNTGRISGTHSFGWWTTQNGGLVLDSERRVVRGHDVTVKADMRGEYASRTIWHELQHAVQEERWMRMAQEKRVSGGFSGEYRRDRDRYERDACEAERRHDDWYPLATDWRMGS